MEKKKTSESMLKAVKKYKSKLVFKQVAFTEDEIPLLDKAEDKAFEQNKSFTKYVKDLIKDDVSDSG